MAGAGIKEIKTRINSVNSTKQVTKAMELVASSKMRKAKERALASRPYFNTMYDTVRDIATNTRGIRNVFLKQREVKNKKAEKPKKCLKYFFIKTFYYTEHKKSIEKTKF